MRLLDSRRLLGPNLMSSTPAVIAEVALDPGETATAAIGAWRHELARLLAALDWPSVATQTRAWAGGVALAFTAPLDVLLPATDVNEHAVASAAELLAGRPPLPLEPRRSELAAAIAAAASPGLVALRAEACARGVPFLLDDRTLTLGMAARAASWPREQLPGVAEVAWADLGRVPVGMVTGTNGKTTSTRLAARIAKEAGRVAGATSTDGVVVDGELVERGDYTGPAGALAVLRRPEIELAILETARGGILRRGLAVERCEAALLTNVSADHLGDYGIDDVATMVRVKSVVARAARVVVLNAEDAGLVATAPEYAGRVVWFSPEPAHPVLAAQRARGGEAWTVEDGALVRHASGARTVLSALDAIPLTFGGRARYNVENALGAAALAHALGLSDEAIRRGLERFTSSERDNPGRGNLFRVGAVRVLLDFGHNPAGLRGVLGFARALAADAPMTIIFGMPGDRLDLELAEVAQELAAARPTRVLLRELGHYLRGRAPGVVPAVLRSALLAAGYPAAATALADDEVGALALALDAARPGELVVVLPHVEHEPVRSLLAARGASAE